MNLLKVFSTVTKPILQALLVADHIYVDATTGKKVVAGIFHDIYLLQRHSRIEIESPSEEESQREQRRIDVPVAGMQAGSPYCYMSITNVRSACALDLRFVDLGNEQVLIQAKVTVNADSPLKIIECVVPMPMLPILHAGTYAFEVLCEDEPIGSYRINAIPQQVQTGVSNGN